MKTDFAEPPQLQDEGEDCASCKSFWAFQNLPPMTLVYLRDGAGDVVFTDGGIPIVICPHCDGEAIIRLNNE